LYFSGASTTTAAPSRMHAWDRRPPMPIASSACIRAAFSRAGPDEEAKWRTSRAKAIRQGNIEENDVGWIAFLVALTDRRNGDQSGKEAHRSMAARRRIPI